MNSTELTYLLQNPDKIDGSKAMQLENVLNEFPYFQSARVIQLKHLNNSNSYKYNKALKKTAAYTIDRNVLFEFITAPFFISDKKHALNNLEEIEVIEAETIEHLHKKITESVSVKDKPSEIAPKEVNPIVDDEPKTILEIGTPIHFKSSEPHSFNEWMQLIAKKPISREENIHNSTEKHNETENKFDLIEKFIESNPKIKPVDKTQQTPDVSVESSKEDDRLMTETLAKVYLEQKKYKNAIKAYRILSLKYPEKSSFFAHRIKAIKILQRNKS